MREIASLFVVAFYVLALSTIGFAGKRYDRDGISSWWDKSEILEQLELSDQQKSEIGEIASSNEKGLETLYTQLKTSYKDLGEKMRRADSSRSEILSAYDRLENIHNELRKVKIEMMLTMRDVLTLEQRTRLSAATEQHEKNTGKQAKREKRGLLSGCL